MKNNKPCKKEKTIGCECNCHDPKSPTVPFLCMLGICMRCGKTSLQKPEQKVADHLFNQAIDQTRKTIHPQPTEQKECECHCHHHGNCVEDAACIAMYCEHCHPQPTDGLINWEKTLAQERLKSKC